eukprot:CAMPEP_0175056154 /NCGR_PEP_ID=MMETSP0052_2-20121109/10505_1 /TAXON_ID=51329 ORGANISM="Polytomella parva, Strain SAG 63-3" /NCGR_SAMPLE_ID=MMETSP0052_2 /ASSEMBLY_ACC=CAM_ASM_000194 /LENGTH=328 /DNA_ID=CAMNT_0016321133 /DNA_START=101 /DNA_END=1087 /DNA_ORIENTATION=-
MASNQPLDSSDIVSYHKLSVYQTKARLYIIGYNKQAKSFSLLKFSKQEPKVLDVVEDPGSYTLKEINNLLRQIHEANAQLGGLQLVTQAYGILGCFHFTETYYLLLLTKRTCVGVICGHKVYTVSGVTLIPLHPSSSSSSPFSFAAEFFSSSSFSAVSASSVAAAAASSLFLGGGGGDGSSSSSSMPDSAAERRYRKLLLDVDLTKNYYFSYTYNLANTLQYNCCGAPPGSEVPAFVDDVISNTSMNINSSCNSNCNTSSNNSGSSNNNTFGTDNNNNNSNNSSNNNNNNNITESIAPNQGTTVNNSSSSRFGRDNNPMWMNQDQNLP